MFSIFSYIRNLLTDEDHIVFAACDVPGIKRLLPRDWRKFEFFDDIYRLVGVPVVTVQLRYNGWVTELQDLERSRWFVFCLHLDTKKYFKDRCKISLIKMTGEAATETYLSDKTRIFTHFKQEMFRLFCFVGSLILV